jgi:hypothetical protein
MKYLANIVSVLTIAGIVGTAYNGLIDTLATKQDLRKINVINSFKWAESNIKINDLQLDNLDRIKESRALTTSESRHYSSIEKSTERIVKAQEALLENQTVIN